MDARVVAQVSSTGSRETSGQDWTSRTLAEMRRHVYPRYRSRGLVRPDVAGGTVKVASIRSHLAERATDWNPCRTDYRSCTMDGLRSAQADRHGETGARENTMVMRLFGFVRICVFGVGMAAGTGAALAFDDTVFDDSSGVRAESSPWDVFKFGYSAYQSGHKDQAAEAYRYAAEKGQIGATWKLARMYASGDGVARDDYEAYKFFSEIVEQDVEPGSRDESYVSDALVALGGYMKTGIPGTPVQADPMAAQEYYMRAAANYRNPSAQYEMGKIFLKGDGGVKASVRQAGRWFQLAAEKGHAGAQATLGNLLFQSGKVVRGLAMMTAALERATPADQPWIRGMQEEAFSLAGEADRRTAIALAQDILGKGDSDSQ